LDLNYLFPDDQIDLLDNNDRTTQLDARAEDDDSIDANFIKEILAEDRILNDDPNEAPGPMEVVGDYLAPQPEPQTFFNIPVCVPINNQNNTNRDLHVVQDPNEDPENLEDTFDTISIIMETAESINRARPDPTATPEAEIEENAVQRCRRKKKEKEKAAEERTKFLIADKFRLEATIAVHEQELGLPQSQTSSAPPTREAPYTVPPKFQCDHCKFSSRSQHGLKIHTGKAHKLHTVALPLPCTTSVVYNLIPVISYILQPQPSSTLLSQNAPAFSAPATSIIPNSTAIPTPDTTPDPEPEKTENAVQKCRRIKKEKKDEDLLMTEFLIDDNTRLKATIAILEQQLGLPQSQTSSMPPTRCVTVSESNTHAHPGKIQRGSVIHRETPYTVPPKFQCDQCDFSSPSQHGLKIHTGKAHKLHTVDLSSTARDPADAKRSREYRLREKIKEDNAVEKLKSLKEQNKNLKDQEAQLRTRVEQSLFK